MHQPYHHWFAGAGKACSAGQSREQAWWGSLDMWAGRGGPQVCTGSGSLHASHGGVHPVPSAYGFPGHMHTLLSVLPSVLCHCEKSSTCLICCAMQPYVYHQRPHRLRVLCLQVFSPSMPRGYTLQSFRSDLKALMLKTGVEGQPVCLFLEDHQMVDPGFLECINSLLSGGEVTSHHITNELPLHSLTLFSQFAVIDWP